MHALRPYPSYRESGVPWLGEVPAHWEVRRLKYVLRERDIRSVDGSEQLLRVSQYTGVTQREPVGVEDEPDTRAESLVGYKCVEPNDLVVNIMLAWNGSMGVSRYPGIASPAYCVYRFRSDLCPWYFHYAFRSYPYKSRIRAVSTGVVESRLRLYTDDLFRLEAFLPPPSEQTAIVRFLDHADRRIRRYIRAKEKLIALLEEQKQTIIHQAVTGRVDVRTGRPYPDYKPSGVEWLGDVPAHWQVLRLGRVINLKVGFPFKSDDFTQSEEDMRLLRGINVASGQLRWDEVVRWPADDVDAFSEYKIEVGDIILGMDRPIISSGIRVAVASESDVPSLLLQRVACIRPDPESLVRKFAFWILGSNNFVNYLSPIFTGISVPHLSAEQIKEFWVSLPDIAEQEVIITYLTSRLSAIQSATERAQRQIDLFREFRTRLIADVVTGKLDVREAAAALPEVDPLAAAELAPWKGTGDGAT